MARSGALFSALGHLVEAAAGERVAAGKATQGHAAAAERAEAGDGDFCVFRAGGTEAAAADPEAVQHRRKEMTVDPEKNPDDHGLGSVSSEGG